MDLKDIMKNATTSTADGAAKPKPKLRWYQFSLRTLLIAVTLFAILCSWFAVRLRANQQKAALEKLDIRFAFYDYQIDPISPKGPHEPAIPTWLLNWLGKDFFYDIVIIRIRRCEVADLENLKRLPKIRELILCESELSDKGLSLIKYCAQLQTLDISSTKISDEGLASLKNLPKLTEVMLSYDDITDHGLVNLQECMQIEKLELQGTKISDAGLQHLSKLTHLKKLGLGKNSITDAGLVHLDNLDQLECLSLDSTDITDSGFEFLKQLKNLKTLVLSNTKIGDQGLAHLEELPNIENIYLNSGLLQTLKWH